MPIKEDKKFKSPNIKYKKPIKIPDIINRIKSEYF